MIRFALAIVVALCLSPAQLYAQTQRFTVTAMSASIYQAPSAGSPVIGQSSKGAVLDVRKELAGWVEIWWPTAKGMAYVPTATGSIEKPGFAPVATEVRRPMTIDEFVHGTGRTQSATSLAASGSPNSSAASAAYVAEAVQAVAAASTPRPTVTPSNALYVAPTHFVGLGARFGDLTPSVGSVGGTGRVWSRTGVGVQFEMTRDARTNAATAERVTSLQFAPSVLYALPNGVSDYFWVRPYLGAGAMIDRSTLRSVNPGEVGTSDGSLGMQLFGGGEVTFAGLPRFALSADVGYRKMPAGFAGFERRKIHLGLSGHWFVR